MKVRKLELGKLHGAWIPLLFFALVAIWPKLLLLWLFIVVAKPIAVWSRGHLPDNIRCKVDGWLRSDRVRNSGTLRELNEGADQSLPFVLFSTYLCCAPFALLWMIVHWVQGFLPQRSDPTGARPAASEELVFKQNKRQAREYSENNFYHSKAFGITVFAVFALGLPAFFTNAVYERTGMANTLMQQKEVVPVASYNPPMAPPAVSQHKRFGSPPMGSDSTVVAGYNGFWPGVEYYKAKLTPSSLFMVHFYLMSVAIALSMLFFRSWFTFPLNFLSDEHDIVVTADGVRRRGMNGWFLTLLTLNRFAIGGGPDSMRWEEVKSLRRLEEGFTRLHPLPETAFKKESLTYKFLNKIAAFIDGCCRPMASGGKYLVFSATAVGGDLGTNIRVDVNQLSREQRAKLFYAVKNWAPDVVIQENAEELLLGSTVLRDNRYTKLWFDMLTTKVRRKPKNVLESGDVLRGGEYVIQEYISSGGQASTYRAVRADGEPYVLKEFILCSSGDSGALIDSAREFESEVSLLSQLNHPGIVRLDDYFFEDGRVYIALEYVNGMSLRKYVQERGPMSEKEVGRIASSICDVLEYLHSGAPPVVHRDVTPENILIDETGAVKLIDFSLAVKQDGKRTTDSCAKQCFTPPEQFREEACPQSDLYALGATMYYLLTGNVPKPITRSSPRLANELVSETMNAIVERATELDLGSRYESAHWMKLDLTTAGQPDPEPEEDEGEMLDIRQAAFLPD